MSTLSPALTAGLLLAALPFIQQHQLPGPTAAAVLQATGATRTTAYKVKALVESVLPELLRPPGRPPNPPPAVDATTRLALAHKIRDFLFAHPGCVSSGRRNVYSERFHLFVLELNEDTELPYEVVAEETGVPLGTLKDWMRGERPEVQPVNAATAKGPAESRIQTVLDAWERWDGTTKDFVTHVQFDLRVPFSRKTIQDLLRSHGVHIPKRRRRDPDASAGRGSFETFFPNAQWVGDGTELVIHLLGHRVTVNLEFLVDTDTAAIVGASIRSTEDAIAVTEAFADGVHITVEAPIAVLLDNKPSNHGEVVDEALGDTLRLRSRPYEPTDKPHVEGVFGLFKREAPDLVLQGGTPEELATEVARLVVTTWARAANHRPRLDREGKSRVDLFRGAEPTEEDKARAREALRERQRKQERARQTRARRQDPIARAILDSAFGRLGLEDPERHLRTAIASWPLDAIIEGIAVFEGKKRAGTLPDGVDGRYLRGIVKNLAQEREGWEISEALLRERLGARDAMLQHLGRRQDAIEEEAESTETLIKRYVGLAMETRRGIDRTFWLLATADVIRGEREVDYKTLLRLGARRIHGTYSVPHRERLAATRLLYAKVLTVS